jgi:uncharacterized protein (DUF488 family)
MKRTISTIGYEGATIQEFVATLQLASVAIVIDVRAVPLSRKKGFSKNGLAEHLHRCGISYIHLKGLGDPKEGREAARAGNHALFLKIFGRHMRSAVAQEALTQAEDLVRAQNACLMCFEAEHEKCHRMIVASQLAHSTGLKVTPLAVRDYTKGRIAA